MNIFIEFEVTEKMNLFWKQKKVTLSNIKNKTFLEKNRMYGKFNIM